MEERNMKKKVKTGILSVLLAMVLVGGTVIPGVLAAPVVAQPQQIAAAGYDLEIQSIFDSAADYEKYPQMEDPQEEVQFLESYVSPAQKAINAMKARQYSDEQITSVLNEHGYGWDPKTGSCWKGRAPTPEEQKDINYIRGPNYSPFTQINESFSETEKDGTRDSAAGATMNLVDENTYFGINLYMCPGDMAISSTGTFQHVVTTHVGKRKPSGADDWTEAGVARSMNDPTRQYFTYDNDEGGWQFHGTASSSASKNYKIYITSTYESAGYVYHIWIDGSWKRSGHLYYRQTKYNCANEIWALGSNPFSHDATSSDFQNIYLYKTTGYQWWGNYPATQTYWSPDNPPYETHYMYGSSWRWLTWA
ncbi:MAG: hypothetical protein PHR63_09995 [Methanoregulaceae archaeon]|jgi:hypothetical protein|nr:MAG: hypothetical protein APR55_02615 [Methanolinea sp. SDB]MCA9703168.1 hypothetical protein [Methanolinea sp.]MDD3091837.1 hypothetical protein [Methanoregulaceae archaeon]MDD5686062.1 hypothetical protein [Methanoregulaceae archaeon]